MKNQNESNESQMYVHMSLADKYLTATVYHEWLGEQI